MILIGEKINGSIPSCGRAIAQRNEGWIRRLARIQEDAQADYLDCCASVKDGELETLRWLTGIVQDETDTPLCLDSPDPRVCVGAMEFCRKPGIVNSASLEPGKTEVIFPAVAGTSWSCIVLLSGEQGIPRTAADRLENFRRLMDRAAKAGVDAGRLYVDPLVESLAVNPESLTVFAETCRGIRQLCPQVHITSGLSNISFGLPMRRTLNLAFAVLAMEAGMDSAIADPTNPELMGAIFAAQALLGQDEYCMEYIGAWREGRFGPTGGKKG